MLPDDIPGLQENKQELKDGGTRLTYSTGAMKEDWTKTEGKGRYDLLPTLAIREVAEIFRKGAIKYTKWIPVDNQQELIGMIKYCTCEQKEWQFATQINHMLLLACAKTVMKKIYESDKNQENQKLKDLLYAVQKSDILQEDYVPIVIKEEVEKREQQNQDKWQFAIQNFLILVEGYVEIVMNEIFDKEILNLLKDKERIEENGENSTKIELKEFNKYMSQIQVLKKEILSEIEWENYQKNTESHLTKLIESLINKDIHVQYANLFQRKDFLTLITIMKQESQEDFFAPTAIKHLACLEILQTLLKEHSNTCKIHHIYRLNNNQIEKLHNGEWNWMKGIKLSRFVDSAKRHLDQDYEGMIDENHRAQAAWNILCYIQTCIMIERGLLPEELDDRPSFGKPGDPNYRPAGKGFENNKKD